MQIYTFKLNEVQKYLTLSDHCYDMVVFVVGKKWYDGLTDSEKKALQEATEIAKNHMRASVREEDAKALEGIKASGTQVTVLDPAEKKRIRDTAMVEVTRQVEKINKELFQSMMQAIEEASQ
jgi:TRAP-type C4-dicarboxylate transport system substrate-binding protein